MKLLNIFLCALRIFFTLLMRRRTFVRGGAGAARAAQRHLHHARLRALRALRELLGRHDHRVRKDRRGSRRGVRRFAFSAGMIMIDNDRMELLKSKRNFDSVYQ